MMISYRQISRNEIHLLNQIDRTETIERVYYPDGDQLILHDEHWDVPDWAPDNKKERIAALQADYDRGATAFGAFAGDRLIGMGIVDHNFLPSGSRRLNLIGLWVSHGYRARGVGRTLVELAAQQARKLGAKILYVSATPSENTIRFYLSVGCRPTKIIDPALFAVEPEDIHLELPLW
jgi:GNAT superfamily N-acetyltransferase